MLHNIQRGEYALSPAGRESISIIKIFQVGVDFELHFYIHPHLKFYLVQASGPASGGYDESFVLGTLFSFFVCPKERNKEKGSQKLMLRCFWQANAHEHSLLFVFASLIELIVVRFASCYSQFLEALSFSFTFFIVVGVLLQTKKMALEISLCLNKENKLPLSSMSMIGIVWLS